ncbi:MAG: lysophospholipase, partial [Spirochaetales bacterium]|nr:lysophospholipase [Spirochaetales bacterium]
MQGTTVSFPNDRGEVLAAKVDLPADGEPRAWALFAHCFTCTKNLSAVRRIARSLTEEGIAVLSFDFTGLGESEGSFSETTFSSQAADLVAAAEFLKTEYASSPAIMIGHSLGGTATLFAARSIDGVEGIATIGSPADP